MAAAVKLPVKGPIVNGKPPGSGGGSRGGGVLTRQDEGENGLTRWPDCDMVAFNDSVSLFLIEMLMKSLLQKASLRIVLCQLALLLCQNGRAAVGFTITPSAVSNTYVGNITLQVTGLTPGDTVVVQKYLDANADGVIDA